MDVREVLRERFERAIDLPAYLGQRGFEPAAGAPDAAGLPMMNPATGENLLLRKDIEKGGWTYANPAHPSERWTVTDYLRRYDGLTVDACMERLIACADERRFDVPEAVQYRAYVCQKPEALRRAQGEYILAVERRQDATNLLQRVGIKRESLDEWRFGEMNTERDVSRALADPQQLWASGYRAADKRLVFTETPMDAMSLEQSRGDQRACYMATGSRPDEGQKRRIGHVLAELPPGMSVVLAFGRDERGRQLADEIRALAPLVKMERLTPDFGSRWSNQVQLEQRHARAMSRTVHQLAR